MREVNTLTRILTLPSPASAHADVPNVTCLHDIVQGCHGLFDGCVGVKAMTYMKSERKVEPRWD